MLPSCDLNVKKRVKREGEFAVSVILVEDAEELTRDCTARPCFQARIRVLVPHSDYHCTHCQRERGTIYYVGRKASTRHAPCL